LNAPVETITQGYCSEPLNLDVPPLFVVLMGCLCAGAPADAEASQLGDAGIHPALSRRPAIRLEPALLSLGRLVLNPITWQLLFVLGAWLAMGGANTLHFLVRSRAVTCCQANQFRN
jgi:hypothetical protein